MNTHEHGDGHICGGHANWALLGVGWGQSARREAIYREATFRKGRPNPHPRSFEFDSQHIAVHVAARWSLGGPLRGLAAPPRAAAKAGLQVANYTSCKLVDTNYDLYKLHATSFKLDCR